MKATKIQEAVNYPVLPLRDVVIFPKMIAPIFVGRERSINALQKINNNGTILLISQKNSTKDSPKTSELYRVGVLCKVLQILKLQDSSVKILIEGVVKAKVTKFFNSGNYLKAYAEIIHDKPSDDKETAILKNVVIDLFEEYASLNKKISSETLNNISQIEDTLDFCNAVCSQVYLNIDKKQQLLEISDIKQKLEKFLFFVNMEVESLKAEKKIKSRVREQVEKNQKDYYLHEQLKAIHKELGEEDHREEFRELEEKIKKNHMSKEAQEKASSEFKKLKMTNPMSSESVVIRNYLDWLLSLPWKTLTKDNDKLDKAESILNEEHYSLDKVKERILEYLAVCIKSKKLSGSIICLVGAPGVGKTSLAQSISKAIGKKFAKITLGGLRDEAEIKGHRRTYIGAMPGKVIQAIKKAKSSNPVILLDEIDKLGSDYRGDPASGLLEVLDPSQNNSFVDHYMEVGFDISKVMFIATSNTLDIPYALLDRMEIIRLSGYTENDKLQIAKKHLIPRIRSSHKMLDSELSINDRVLIKIIREYTRESGVRSLYRALEKIFRKAVKETLITKKPVSITEKNIVKFLGPQKFNYEYIDQNGQIGITNGLAYTEYGGDILAIEAVKYKGKGNIKITGKLGEVMKESVQASYSYIHSRAAQYGIKEEYFKLYDIHLHVPEGATPKDGPSAGITISTSIFSILTGIPVKGSVAMTGEITLRGRVLKIGGLKEKLLAASRAGIKTVLIPFENCQDLVDIPSEIKNSVEIIPVKSFDEVLEYAFDNKKNKNILDNIRLPIMKTFSKKKNEELELN